jgi:hypothetical protein
MQAHRLTAVVMFWVLALGQGPASRPADTPQQQSAVSTPAVDELSAMRAQVRVLRAQLMAAREENARLRAEVATLHRQLLSTTAPASTAPARQPDRPAQATYSLQDLPPTDIKQLQARVGGRLYGPVVISQIEPVSGDPVTYRIVALDKHEYVLPLGHARLVNHKWIRVACVITVSESWALIRDVGDELNIAGDIERVEFIPAKGRDIAEIRYYLREVNAR